MQRKLLAPAAIAVALIAVLIVVATSGGDDKPAPDADKRTTARAHPTGAPARQGPPRRAPVPVLMYHEVNPVPPSAAYPELYVPPDAFAAQMETLAQKGYRGVTLNQVEDAWSRGTPLPRRPIVVSFDDGYRGQLENAFPVLRRLHWSGVLSLESGALKSPDGLSRAQVAQLLRGGWELASHTIDHSDVRTLSPDRLSYEIHYSRLVFRRMFHVPVNNFTYPAGKYNDAAVKEVRASGYRGALTVDPGLASRNEPFVLKRVRISGPLSGSGLLRKLSELGE